MLLGQNLQILSSVKNTCIFLSTLLMLPINLGLEKQKIREIEKQHR